jgi:hypothetical protein
VGQSWNCSITSSEHNVCDYPDGGAYQGLSVGADAGCDVDAGVLCGAQAFLVGEQIGNAILTNADGGTVLDGAYLILTDAEASCDDTAHGHYVDGGSIAIPHRSLSVAVSSAMGLGTTSLPDGMISIWDDDSQGNEATTWTSRGGTITVDTFGLSEVRGSFSTTVSFVDGGSASGLSGAFDVQCLGVPH